MDGLLRCSRYAFGPNRLHYCGPDMNAELAAHMTERKNDAGLSGILSKFETLYPYLQLIARANKIADPFDDRVVETYWLGNELLDQVTQEQLYWHMKDTLKVQKKIGVEGMRQVTDRWSAYTVPHHAFHVLEVWREGIGKDSVHTEANIAECIVNTGVVRAVSGVRVTIDTKPLRYDEQQGWHFGAVTERVVTRDLGSSDAIDDIAIDDRIAYHWGVPCEVLTDQQASNLERYTVRSLRAMNNSE
jgi:hypothetical protein